MKNRELKFRIWDKQDKKMLEDFSIEHLINNYNSEYAKSRDDISNFNYETDGRDYDIMQFTGLLDKSGKEIYEGDIVLNRFSPGRQEKLVLTDDIFYIVYRLRDILAKRKNDLNNELEIIGNVFENPNLLSHE